MKLLTMQSLNAEFEKGLKFPAPDKYMVGLSKSSLELRNGFLTIEADPDLSLLANHLEVIQ